MKTSAKAASSSTRQRRQLHRDLEQRLHPIQRHPDGTFEPLPAKHVDTGMGFERVCSIIQGTKNFTDFENAKISNYDTDVFRPSSTS
jgi:alanyl-tRNA synthetase